jgi:hypothetical protein
MDANERLHQEWLGMAQPEGLVVTKSALKAAEANITWPVIELQASLKDLAGETKNVLDLPRFFADILDWSSEFVVDRQHLPETLSVPLDGGGVLTPNFAVRSADDDGKFVLLVGLPEKLTGELDAATDDKRWTATPHQKFERLLRDSGVHVGLLTNGKVFRLVYAPKGESAGWVTFRLADMLSVDGRPLLGALHMLLNERRLLSLEPEKRLPGLLKSSRDYQNTVSNALRAQILAALRELLHGFEHADRVAKGTILGEVRRDHFQEVYVGLVTVLMRMVFVLFAEERNLLPMENDLYASSYSFTRLYAQLLEEQGRFGDGLDDRYGAWARVITLFRVVHDGVKAADGLVLPARRGDFFNPDAFPFLEGRPRGSSRQLGESLDIPRISDGVVFRVLHQLLVLGGERLQYRALDVEQIGSVYEGLMGFDVEVAEGNSLCLTPEHVVVNLDELLRQAGPDRAKTLKEKASVDLKDKAGAEVKAAKTVEALQAALSKRISSQQPGLIAPGSFYLQPGEERRKSGSHYTPKSLTAPIVETTLRPILERLGPDITPEQILALKICDPAMGSAAFLVEACRQLADLLVAAWRRTNSMPDLPPDEDPRPARPPPHRPAVSLRCGQEPARGRPREALDVARDVREGAPVHVRGSRAEVRGLASWTIEGTDHDPEPRRHEGKAARHRAPGRLARHDTSRRPPQADPRHRRPAEHRRTCWPLEGRERSTAHRQDARGSRRGCVFLGRLRQGRKKSFDELSSRVTTWLATGAYEVELKGMVAELRGGDTPATPFHWEVEFPEVFTRENPGFDCFVGNPPFMGGKKISAALGVAYRDWLAIIHDKTTSNADIAAHFFRRTFLLLRVGGAEGLIGTNSIAQGETRWSGLTWLCSHGATIYSARRRWKWPGVAVVISVVHVSRGPYAGTITLDGKDTARVSAYLFSSGPDDDPLPLRANASKSFIGSYVLGIGFTFEDGRPGAGTIAEGKALQLDPAFAGHIKPYINGEEVNTFPNLVARRLVVDFEDLTEEQARRWPELIRNRQKRG